MREDPFQPTEIAQAVLPRKPVPPKVADGFKAIQNGRQPRTGEKKLTVQFRNGYIDRRNTYIAKQMRWSDTGDEWDIIAVKLA